MTTIPSGSTTAGEIARHLGATLLGDGSVRIDRLEVFDLAGPACLTFVRSARFAKMWAGAKAGSALISSDIVSVAAPEGTSQPSGRSLIVVPDADLAAHQGALAVRAGRAAGTGRARDGGGGRLGTGRGGRFGRAGVRHRRGRGGGQRAR